MTARGGRGLYAIVVFLIVALLSHLLANEWPLFASKDGRRYFPALHQIGKEFGLASNTAYPDLTFFQIQPMDMIIHAPIPYSATSMDEQNSRSVSPFAHQAVESLRYRHWLGTDELGHDVLAVLLHGTVLALLVGAGSMTIAGLIGVLLGAVAGYFGDGRLRVSRAHMILFLIGLPLACFYGFGCRYYVLLDAYRSSLILFLGQMLLSLIMGLFILFAFVALARFLERLRLFSQYLTVPVDMLVIRMIEVLNSLPLLFLILAIVAIAKPSLVLVVLVIGFTSWTGIARLVRAEMLRIRNLSYMEAAQALGYSPIQSIVKHALPNLMEPVFVALAFGFANAILVESGLSFLGLGVPPEVLTWGALLAEARQSTSSWWLALMPGLAIFSLVYACNNIAEVFTKRRESRVSH